MSNNFFTIASLFYSIMLVIIYFNRDKVNTSETKIYSYMIISNFLTVVTAIICYGTISINEKIPAINNFVSNTGLNDVKTTFDSKTGIASVIGNKDGFQYTTTLTKHMNGVVQTTTQFATNLGKEALISQIKALRKQGYKQQQIADMLKISQATVSKYLRK